MNGWTYKWMNEWMNEWKHEWLYEWINEYMSRLYTGDKPGVHGQNDLQLPVRQGIKPNKILTW